MKALFLTADLGGNVPPTLAVATALSHRNVAVEIAGLPGGRTALTQTDFPAATVIKPDGQNQEARQLGALGRLMSSRKTSAAAGSLIARRMPDVVVADCMVPAVRRARLIAAFRPWSCSTPSAHSGEPSTEDRASSSSRYKA